MLEPLDLGVVVDTEVKRRLKLLGGLIDQPEDKACFFQARKRKVGIPSQVLENWFKSYLLKSKREDK